MTTQLTPMTPSSPMVVTMAEAGRLLGLSRMSIHKLIVTGRLRVRRFGRAVRVPVTELERLAKPSGHYTTRK